ncbi:unnamed protein product [Diamesa tonsa]
MNSTWFAALKLVSSCNGENASRKICVSAVGVWAGHETNNPINTLIKSKSLKSKSLKSKSLKSKSLKSKSLKSKSLNTKTKC